MMETTMRQRIITIQRLAILALLVVCTHFLIGGLRAADEDLRWFDVATLRVHTGTTDIDVSAADLTTDTVILTIEPSSGQGLRDVRVTFDLDSATAGWSSSGSTETIQFLVARKIDGTNYRVDPEQATTALSSTNSNLRSVSILVGDVGVTEACRIIVLEDTETIDVELPYVVTYRAPQDATFTDVAN